MRKIKCHVFEKYPVFYFKTDFPAEGFENEIEDEYKGIFSEMNRYWKEKDAFGGKTNFGEKKVVFLDGNKEMYISKSDYSKSKASRIDIRKYFEVYPKSYLTRDFVKLDIKKFEEIKKNDLEMIRMLLPEKKVDFFRKLIFHEKGEFEGIRVLTDGTVEKEFVDWVIEKVDVFLTEHEEIFAAVLKKIRKEKFVLIIDECSIILPKIMDVIGNEDILIDGRLVEEIRRSSKTKIAEEMNMYFKALFEEMKRDDKVFNSLGEEMFRRKNTLEGLLARKYCAADNNRLKKEIAKKMNFLAVYFETYQFRKNLIVIGGYEKEWEENYKKYVILKKDLSKKVKWNGKEFLKVADGSCCCVEYYSDAQEKEVYCPKCDKWWFASNYLDDGTFEYLEKELILADKDVEILVRSLKKRVSFLEKSDDFLYFKEFADKITWLSKYEKKVELIFKKTDMHFSKKKIGILEIEVLKSVGRFICNLPQEIRGYEGRNRTDYFLKNVEIENNSIIFSEMFKISFEKVFKDIAEDDMQEWLDTLEKEVEVKILESDESEYIRKYHGEYIDRLIERNDLESIPIEIVYDFLKCQKNLREEEIFKIFFHISLESSDAGLKEILKKMVENKEEYLKVVKIYKLTRDIDITWLEGKKENEN